MTAFGNFTHLNQSSSGDEQSGRNSHDQNQGANNRQEAKAPQNGRALNASLAEQVWAFSPANFQKQNQASTGDLPASGYGAGARARSRANNDDDFSHAETAAQVPVMPAVNMTRAAVTEVVQEVAAAPLPAVAKAATTSVGEGKTLRSILPKTGFGGKAEPGKNKIPVDATAISETFATQWTTPKAQPSFNSDVDTGPNPVVTADAASLNEALHNKVNARAAQADPVVQTSWGEAYQAETASAPSVAEAMQAFLDAQKPAQMRALEQPSAAPVPVYVPKALQEDAKPQYIPTTEMARPVERVEVRADVIVEEQVYAPVTPVIAAPVFEAPKVEAPRVEEPKFVAPAQMADAPPAVQAREATRPGDFDVKSHPLFANLNKEMTRPAESYNARMDKPAAAMEDLSRQVMPADFRLNGKQPGSPAAPEVVAGEDPFAADNCYQSMEISPDGVFKTTTTLPDLSASKIETRNPDKSYELALTDHLNRPTIEQRFDKNNHLVSQTNSRFEHVDAPMVPSHRIVKTATQTIETTLDATGAVIHSRVMPFSDLNTSKSV